VLVQREMESGRSLLASRAPLPDGVCQRRRIQRPMPLARDEVTAGTPTGFKKEIMFVVPSTTGRAGAGPLTVRCAARKRGLNTLWRLNGKRNWLGMGI
jgi:hypothetical protein